MKLYMYVLIDKYDLKFPPLIQTRNFAEVKI